jgi:hypothetical protein
MPTRYNAKPESRFNDPGLPSGYNGHYSKPSDYSVPSVGIEDVDVALFKLFNNEIPLQVITDIGLKKVPVIFAAGEKWAMVKKNKAIKDKNGSLILPLITMFRTSIVQDMSEDITGRGINQQTGELVIKRRLDTSDRGYQSLINKLLIKNQDNIAVSPEQLDDATLSTTRAQGELTTDYVVRNGGVLHPDKSRNVFETLVIPSPQFYTAQYDVTIWAQYTTHMNQILQQIISSFLPQGNCWKLQLDNGYWFVAKVDQNSYTADNNVDDYSQEERIIKYKYNIKVPAYILATDTPGAPVPVRRYLSNPVISFSVGLGEGEIDESNGESIFLGADDPTLPIDANDSKTSKRRDQRDVRNTRLFPSNSETSTSEDPAIKKLGRQNVYQENIDGELVRVKSVNKFTGETVLSKDANLGKMNLIITKQSAK